MILIVHEGNPRLADDVAAARERIHPATMAAEGPLHDLGAISIINSDSQGMGRIGETIRRTWQLAHVMKRWRRRRRPGSGWPNDARRRQRAGAPLPGQVHGRARPRPRHRGGGRLARARAPGRPGAVGSRVVRREAGDGDEGRRRRVGTRSARATHRCTARSPRGSAPTGAPPATRSPRCDDVRLAGRARRRLRLEDSSAGRRRPRHAGPHQRSPRREPIRPPASRSAVQTARSTIDGRVLACEPTPVVPLSRRYLLA